MEIQGLLNFLISFCLKSQYGYDFSVRLNFLVKKWTWSIKTRQFNRCEGSNIEHTDNFNASATQHCLLSLRRMDYSYLLPIMAGEDITKSTITFWEYRFKRTRGRQTKYSMCRKLSV